MIWGGETWRKLLLLVSFSKWQSLDEKDKKPGSSPRCKFPPLSPSGLLMHCTVPGLPGTTVLIFTEVQFRVKALVGKSEAFCLQVFIVIVFIQLNSDELGFCWGNAYHNGLTLACALPAALIYGVLHVLCQLFFKWQHGKKMLSTTTHAEGDFWEFRAVGFNLSTRLATPSDTE